MRDARVPRRRAPVVIGSILFVLTAAYAIMPNPEPAQAPVRAKIRVIADAELRDELRPMIDAVEKIANIERDFLLQLTLLDSAASLPNGPRATLQVSAGFWLEVADSGGTLYATGIEGIANGLATLERHALKGGSLPARDILEKPAHAVRALHFVLRGLGEKDLERLVLRARRARMNTIVVQIADALALNTLRETSRDDALSPQAFAEFVRFARANGLDVIPEVKLLTHQEKFLKRAFPDAMYNSATYDPTDPQVQRIVFAYLDELIGLIEPVAIHIGHDEVRQVDSIGKRNGLLPGERPLPAPLYLQSVQSLSEFLAERDIETWMWGDMLLTPDEFPEMDPRNLNGNDEYTAIRKSLPRRIVICDWHYYDRSNFPSAKLFSDLGFPVLGATWKRQDVSRSFSRYVAKLPNARGMISTTWFTVQRGEWDTVNKIVDESGEAFWNGD